MPTPDRRAFLSVFATTSFATTLLPGVLWAQMQQGTKVVTSEMVREAAKLAGLEITDADAADLTSSLSSLARGAEGIGKKALTNASPLPIHFDPRPHGVKIPPPPSAPLFRTEPAPPVRRPANIEAVAFWPITHLAQLLRTRQITSTALTEMYLARLKRHNPQLNCVAQLTEERARTEAAAADKEIAGGKYRGVLHGIPYGVKDIIAARGYPTRWGAKPLDTQTFDDDATVVERLHEAGAVLAAKLTTGELAFGDQWAGGRTNNPWNLQQGSSGSSAGSAAAMGAGLVAFAIGSDTGGSILFPAARCGVVGIRPTFGRVSRYGVMTAGSSLDKIGPMCRHVQDCAIVLHGIAGADNLDLAVPDNIPVTFDATSRTYPKRIGYVPAMLAATTSADQRANNDRVFATLKQLGCTLVGLEAFPSGDLSYFPELLHRVCRTRRGVRIAGLLGSSHRRQPAHRPLPARVRARHRGRLPAGESPPRRHHAGGRAASRQRRRSHVHGAHPQLGVELESGDEPDGTSIDRRAERLLCRRHADGRHVLGPALPRGRIAGSREGL